MENYEDYSRPVHLSLMEKKVLFGIGDKAFYIIGFLTIVICALTTIYAIVLGIIAIIICRAVCKKDPMTIDFALENMMQKDVYEG